MSAENPSVSSPPGALAGVRVLDLATLFAGPMAATILGDFGADVIKVEHPTKGDPVRNHGPSKNGIPLWWAMLSRNKRTIALYLGDPRGAEIAKKLIATCDVLIENFRPGTLEGWGLSPEELHRINPGLVIARVTGFGQFGPYSARPGFGTLAESMSGLAAISGEEGRAPLLPPIALTDEITGLAAAFATMVALHSGVGQVVDVNLLETIFQMMGPLLSVYQLTGEQQQRLGSGIPYTVPRGTFECSDGKWVGVSASSDTVAARVLDILGVANDPRFASFNLRVEHRQELNELLITWCATRPQAEVLRVFEEADAAIGPVYDMADIDQDPHFAAREMIQHLEGTPMQGLIAHLSQTPGALRWQGRAQDADGESIRNNGWGTTSH